jgi:hypothetical protein
MTILQFDPFSSDAWLKKESRSAGTYEKTGEMRSAAFLSTLYVQQIDPGTTIKINFYDATTSASDGERYDLKGHALASSVGHSRILVTRTHNRVTCEAIVTGGSALFSVYVTGLESTDLIDVIGVNTNGDPALRVISEANPVQDVNIVSPDPLPVSVDNFPAIQDVNLVNPSTLSVTIKDNTDNIRTSILAAPDREQSITTLDFGTINERVTQIDYSSSTVYPSNVARKTINYVLDSGFYKRTDIVWSII